MSRFLLSVTLGVAFTCLWGLGARGEVPATGMPKVRNVRVNYACEIPQVPEGSKTIDLWIPVPSSDDRQTVVLLNESELPGGKFTADKKFGNRLYYRRFTAPPAGQPIKVELVYDAEVREQTVPAAKSLASTRQVTPGPEMAPYLGEVKLIPIAGPITQLALGVKLPKGEPLRA